MSTKEFWDELITRAQWGAKYANGFGDRTGFYPLTDCALHHSVTLDLPENATEEQERAQMRTIEQIGQDLFGKGFSYNLAIFRSGRAYQGLGFSRVGAHTNNQNSRTFGIVLVGNYMTNAPTAAQQAKLAQALQALRAEGILRAARITIGHRQVFATACPGDAAYRLIGSINNRAAGAPVSTSKPAPVTSTPKPAPKPAQSTTKPRKAGTGPWPDAYLTVTTRKNQFQDKALENLLGRVGNTGTFAQRLQKHLRRAGYYKGAITARSTVGPQTTRAWQHFLKDRGYYTGAIDGNWGPQTVRSTVVWLNWQADVIARG